jgi:NAD(P)H-hydrate repair Nnr-like enzyme with NAD(P)H-hydrate dehydratase domain
MPGVNVVVVFYSRYGATEQLALAAGVGAVQAHANIRLRRLKDLADPEAIARDPSWAENLERMNRDYIAPREIDVDWADVVLVASCPESLRETEKYVEDLLATPGRNDRLVIVPLADGLQVAGDRLGSAREQAHKAVENARKLKS